MTTKLKLTPNVSYALGIYSVSRDGRPAIGLRTRDGRVMQKFIEVVIKDLGIEPGKVVLGENMAFFYNSKLKKLFDRALDRRTKTFKYMNDYSGSYVAGLFDCSGGIDRKGMFIRNLDAHDSLLLENIGIHTMVQGSKSYIIDEKRFVELAGKHSCTLDRLVARG